MKKFSFKRIVSVLLVGMFAAMLLPIGALFCKNDITADASVSATKPAVLSNEEYYRLLYANDFEAFNKTQYAFKKSGYEGGEIEFNQNSIQLCKWAGIVSTALSFVTKNPAVSSLLKIVSYGLKAQSIYSVNQNTADMLNELSENLEGVYDALSTDIETSTKVLSEQLLSQTGYIVDTLKRENYAKSISEFFSSDFGTDVYGQKVGYYSWKKSLFNDYSRLVYFTNAESADEKDLRQVYDDLYVNARRLSVLSAAMTGTKSITDIPIQQTLYNYYLLRANTSQDVDMTSAVNSCIDFVRDMYETYLFAQTCLSVCYRYQIDWLDEKYDGVYDTKSYPLYDERDRTVSYYSEIKPYIAAPEAGLETINAELASYFSYILQLCEYYQYNYEGELRKVVYNTFSSAQTSGSVPV